MGEEGELNDVILPDEIQGYMCVSTDPRRSGTDEGGENFILTFNYADKVGIWGSTYSDKVGIYGSNYRDKVGIWGSNYSDKVGLWWEYGVVITQI
jgi:hypothetical protein